MGIAELRLAPAPAVAWLWENSPASRRRDALSIAPGTPLVDGGMSAVSSLRASRGSVAVIGVPSLVAELTSSGLGPDSLGDPVVVVEAQQAKGREFDAVGVADPAAIVASALDEMRGMRLLYVALTRPKQALTVVHGGDPPGALAG